MKKNFLLISLCMITLLSCGQAFGDPQNMVYAKSFGFSSIENLDISLSYENLLISQIYGDEISVEIGSNNIKKFPEVILDETTLTIKTKEQKSRFGNKCTVYLYLPQDFVAQSISIKTASGTISADILKSQNAVHINNVSGRTDIGLCNTELFDVSTVSGNAKLQKITADYFDFISVSGDIFAELEKAPLASSGIKNTSGKSQLYVPKGSNLTYKTSSISGKITNNTTTVTNSDATQITISSTSGKIEIKEY